MPAMISGCGERQQVVVALEVARPVGEPLAAVARLVGPVALDHRAHRAVEDQDAPAERGGELVGGVGAAAGDSDNVAPPAARRRAV